MCTVVISRARRHASPSASPVIVAANRDEMTDRPWDPPAAHWPQHPGVVGGRDRLAGGTWMAIRGGMLAAVLNRPGSLGPAPGIRSRGELPLRALAHRTPAAAAEALLAEDAGLWRPFNLLLADADEALLLVGSGSGPISVRRIGEGVSMITAAGIDEGETARARRHLPRFRASSLPSPSDPSPWWSLLAATDGEAGAGPRGGMTVTPEGGYGTVSASLVFLPGQPAPPVWLFSPGPAGRAAPSPVALDTPADALRD